MRHAIPHAWTVASPSQVIDARLEGIDGALRRACGDLLFGPAVDRASAFARQAAEACDSPGRPLFAGHASLPWPEEPHLVLWHAITLLREYRGDGHVACLVEAGLDGLDALALAPWRALGSEKCDELRALGRPLSKAVVANGFPTIDLTAGVNADSTTERPS